MSHIGNNASNSFQKNLRKKKPNLNVNQNKAQDQQIPAEAYSAVTFKLSLSK